jgi:hypothetical protein
MALPPTFDGNAMFGFPVTCWVTDPPREQQINGFPGVNGVEVLDLGARYRQIHVRGRMTGNDANDLGVRFEFLRAYKNEFGYTFMTTKGEYFFNVKLYSIDEEPMWHIDPATGECYQNYSATFICLQ